jgi:hypothetical protein
MRCLQIYSGISVSVSSSPLFSCFIIENVSREPKTCKIHRKECNILFRPPLYIYQVKNSLQLSPPVAGIQTFFKHEKIGIFLCISLNDGLPYSKPVKGRYRRR